MRYINLILLFLLLVRCSSSENPSPKLPVSVYVTGMHEMHALAYWKDGKKHLLDDGGTLALTTDIVVSDGNVYISGYDNIDHDRTRACYWKNDELFVIGGNAETDTTWAEAIAVSGSDVYVAGTQTKVDGYHGVYWKNGELHELHGPPDQSIVTGMAISENNVYICGYVMIFDPEEYPRYQAAYWKNGVLKLLPDGAIESQAKDIAVENGDVYVVGYNFISGSGNQPKVLYWKNDEPHELPAISSPANYYLEANDIAVEDGHVYISGREFSFDFDKSDKGIYWVNGEPTSITSGNKNVFLFDIAVWDGEVFTIGREGSQGYYWWNKKRYKMEGNQPMPAAITLTLNN